MSLYLLCAIFDPGEAGRAPPELAGRACASLLILLISSVFELFPEFAYSGFELLGLCFCAPPCIILLF